MTQQVHVIILAAGQGTRMRSAVPKVMHKIGGKPLISHVVSRAMELMPESLTVVIGAGPEQAQVKETVLNQCPTAHIAVQESQKGTAHAVLAAKAGLGEISGSVLVLFGDTPLIKKKTLVNAVTRLQGSSQAGAVVLALENPYHPHYGRLVLTDIREVARIVEMKDATEKERTLPLCNSGVMALQGAHLWRFLEKIQAVNKAGEYYLTDVVEIARKKGMSVVWQKVAEEEVMGVNTRADLAAAERLLQQKLRAAAMEKGVTFLDPESVYLCEDTCFEQDVTIYPHVYFGPKVSVGKGVDIHSFSHIEGACIEAGASIGPFARIRPETHIHENAKVGNFVELKKTVLGQGSKVSHLTYLGDTYVGQGCNIGAGTITCNYDGRKKHETHLEDGVFVGSNSTLIAPLRVKTGAYIGAGSVITKDVSADALALSRVPQTEREGGAALLRRRK